MDEDHAPGVAWVLNDPYRGGTHLPDITVITPAFADGRHAARLRRQPRPPRRRRRPDARLDARRLDHARRRGRRDRAAPARRRTRSRSSSRRCASRPSAAPTCARSSPPTAPASSGCASCTTAAACRTRWPRRSTTPSGACAPASRRSPTATRSATDVLEAREGDLELTLTATVAGDELTLDFTGSAAQHGGNLNCPLSVTRRACWFAVRVLTDPDIPPTAGAYRPVTVIAPEGSLLNARPPAAVVAGNVETSLARRRPRARRVRPRARPGHDEQPHARLRRASPTTRRSAAARARARTPTARAASTSRCRTRSTRRSRRSSWSSRCASPSYAIRRGSGGAGRAPRRRRRRPRARGAGGR